MIRPNEEHAMLFIQITLFVVGVLAVVVAAHDIASSIQKGEL